MAFVMGRCIRCGKKLRKDENFHVCRQCKILICEICYRKVRGKCPICGSDLEEFLLAKAA
ncbi:MAG: hypothetical protein NDF56_06530 [archaeon GB-1845-036]|nr:hypothetical protein [Candidatus Verstraetearchaeota archaeon]MCS7374615.1 hypothetical protein [Candidatus Culexmicrobium thermophilum]RLE54509.1 MAG: hypothetical protein DRJ30_05015 [Candidatus Verstraetearchaeota archaeon]